MYVDIMTAKEIETQARQEFESTNQFSHDSKYNEQFSLYIDNSGKIDKATQSLWMLFYGAWIKSRNNALVECAGIGG